MRDDAIARAVLPPGATVADVGTGTGFVLAGLVGQAAHLLGYDASEAMLAVAAKNLTAHPHVTLQQADGQHLPAPDGQFDAVFANMYLHHAPDPAGATAEMVRVLRPGGWLVITDLDGHDQAWMQEEMADHWLGFARDEIAAWFSAAGLVDVVLGCAAGTCDCNSPAATPIFLSVFIALGTKQA